MSELYDNALIAALPAPDRALLERLGTRTALHDAMRLQLDGEQPAYVYFPLSGLASHVVTTAGGDSIQISLLGRDGAYPLAALFFGTHAVGEINVVAGGDALRVPFDALRDALPEYPQLGSVLGRYADGYLNVMVRMAVCNARHSVEERLARWLKLAQEMIGSAESLELTHEALAEILCVRRASITVAAQRLREAGAIDYGFRRITIADNAVLASRACSCYGYVHDLLATA